MKPNLEISTVIGCRMNCDYCPQKVHVRNYTQKSRHTEMTLADFKKMLSTVPKEVEIVFAGMAEPWVDEYFKGYVKVYADQINTIYVQSYLTGY